MSRSSVLAATLLAILALPDRAAAETPPDVGRYFKPAEFAALHPGAQDRLYHTAQHDQLVGTQAYVLGRARGLTPEQATFLGQVGFLHDVDPVRAPGTRPQVPRTIELLRLDFAGERPLIPGANGSVLQQRFGWNRARLELAIAILSRTEFPMTAEHPNPFYRDASPIQHYERALARLEQDDLVSQTGIPGVDLGFAIREAAMFSEYADKASFYFTQDLRGVARAVRGLVGEVEVETRKTVAPGGWFPGTAAYIQALGADSAFVVDRAMARRFRVRVRFVGLAEMLRRVPAIRRRYQANLVGARRLELALKAGRTLDQALGQAVRSTARLRSFSRVGFHARDASWRRPGHGVPRRPARPGFAD